MLGRESLPAKQGRLGQGKEVARMQQFSTCLLLWKEREEAKNPRE